MEAEKTTTRKRTFWVLAKTTVRVFSHDELPTLPAAIIFDKAVEHTFKMSLN